MFLASDGLTFWQELQIAFGEIGVIPAILLLLVLCVIFAVGIAFIVMIHSMRKGRLSKTAFVQSSTAVPEGITKGTEDFTPLVGKAGIAATVLRPGGNALIAGKLYSVVAQAGLIEKDKEIEVVSVEGAKIVVKELENKKSV